MVAERPTGSDIKHPAHHDRRDESFFRMLRGFSPEAQEFVTSLSSMFMEPDERQAFRSDPDNITSLVSELKSMGLRGRQVHRVIRFFNLASISSVDQKETA